MAKEFHVTVDFVDDAGGAVYTKDNIDQMMGYFREIGIKRVYWIFYGGKEEELLWTESGLPGDDKRVATINNLDGNDLAVVAKYAHEHELQIYGLIKPYETGLSFTWPEGSPEAEKYGGIPRIGGPTPCVTKFVREHPNLRIKRNMSDVPKDVESKVIRKIKLVKWNDEPTRVRKENIQIWVSDKNYKYTRLKGDFKFTDSVEGRAKKVIDITGKDVTPKNGRVRVLTLDGLSIKEKYTVLTTNFEGENGLTPYLEEPDFINTGYALVEVYSDEPEPLPITVATSFQVWRPSDFINSGLEFDAGRGNALVILDTDRRRAGWDRFDPSGFIGAARGKNEYLPGALCEAYPEVRAYWLRLVRECIECGVDGLDFRVENHSTHVDDWWAYGFNEPIVEEYKSRYGVNILKEPFDRHSLADLRGEYYTQFLRGAKEEASKNGLRMQVHVNIEAFRPDPIEARRIAYPWNIKFDWQTWIKEGIADEVTLRVFQVPPWQALRDPFTNQVLNLAKSYNKKVYYNRYIRFHELLDDIRTVFSDERIDGFILYEGGSFTKVVEGKLVGREDVKDALAR